MIDTRPFPNNIKVAVKNLNVPDPVDPNNPKDDRFSGHVTFQYNGELWDFPPGKWKLIDPEVAWWMFLYDTRTDIARGGEETPRNYRDRISTGTQGNSGIGTQITLWNAKLAALGWTAPSKAERFEKFEIKTVDLQKLTQKIDLDKLQ